MLILGEILTELVIIFLLFFFNVSLFLSTLILLAGLFLLTLLHGLNLVLISTWIVFLTAGICLNIPILRRKLITAKIFQAVKNKLPAISETEQEVLQAGDVWWEKALLTGRPNWSKFLKFSKVKLTPEEEQFLNIQVDTLCSLLEDYKIVKEGNLPSEVWNYIKQERFLGLVIPKDYNGLGFSAFAHSTIIQKIASKSYSAAVSVMVPNSVGLAEFILHYGTEEQKTYYLPRFVVGEEIPCFALTTPSAGSDAGSMTDKGIVCYREQLGEKKLGVKITFDKRYITLAPIATLIGLAFKLSDPNHLLGGVEDRGITLAMIPRDTIGIEIGKYHSPLMLGFLNGPVRGEEVFIPIDYIIGGVESVGRGWSMMMECLSVGRGLSLPALSTGTAKLCFRMTSAYVNIREQFHCAIGHFEGIKEALARITCFTYLCEATRCLTVSAIDQGIKPSVASAITKYHLTELTRKIVNDAMDIHGGRSIQLGPNNYLGLYYIAQPVSITVEGANILTRNLIIFGQGMLRCHPYIKAEIDALNEKNKKKGLAKFDRLFFKHLGLVLSNLTRSLFYGLSNGRGIRSPVSDETAFFYRQLTRMSVALALITDLSLAVMGKALKQHERLTARLGDVLSYLYLASATLKYYEDHDKPIADFVLIKWIEQYCLYQIATTFELFFANFCSKRLAKIIKWIIFPWGNRYRLPLDEQDHQVADIAMQESQVRDRITKHIDLGHDNDIRKKMDLVYTLHLQVKAANQKLLQAIKAGKIIENNSYQQVLAAKNANILTDKEVNQLLALDRLRLEVIQVDEFVAIPPWIIEQGGKCLEEEEGPPSCTE